MSSTTVGATDAPTRRLSNYIARDGTASTPENIAQALREDLLDGVPSPGSRLTEAALAPASCVAVTPSGHGLQILVSEGLLEHRRNKGILVPEVTEERIDEMCSYRALLELGALRLALGRATDFADVSAAVTHLESLADDTPWRHVIEAHSAVHRAIVEASANDRLVAVHRACENELSFMLANGQGRLLRSAVRDPAPIPRRPALHLGGEAALRALEDDLELGGRSAMHLGCAAARSDGPIGEATLCHNHERLLTTGSR